MIKEIMIMQTKLKYLIQGSIFLMVFLVVYFVLDYLNMSYDKMADQFGFYLVGINVLLNIVMSVLSALMMNLSTAMVELRSGKDRGSNFGFLSILFGILTYGCTTCVITSFAAIGINLIVIALPLAGLPYKLVSLILISVGMYLIIREINHGTCKVNLR